MISVLDNNGGAGSPGVILIMTANLTSGTQSEYEGPGTRIFQALTPDIVAIQEFNVTHAGGRRAFVNEAFGPNFHFMVELGAESIPNGVISRWPIVDSGEWDDPQMPDRDFAWATIDLPGETNLHLVSVHLHSSRNTEAGILANQVFLSFPPGDYIVLAGDSGVSGMQHMAVMKAFFIPGSLPRISLSSDSLNHRMDMTVPTEPSWAYEVEYADVVWPPPVAGGWSPFADPATGRFTENSGVPGLHTFQDDFSATTTSNEPPSGAPVYRVRVGAP